ncbi:hypothetical protein CU024_2306 [Enterococcus faecium]|nr:hypothetical protein [Enterococcus faecium]MBK4764254.1 hypothetical protein [Enterococcus faecium]MBK4791291.1 hypothetical protein [Enterococcus faecium]MBK4799468.1 hypothetical protein [Enterococcus faecium]MBK4820859.1 hypothetical protein [Enterococcus faecium]
MSKALDISKALFGDREYLLLRKFDKVDCCTPILFESVF